MTMTTTTQRRPATMTDLRATGILQGYLAGYPNSWGQTGRFGDTLREIEGYQCPCCGQRRLKAWFFHRTFRAAPDAPEGRVVAECGNCRGAWEVEE
jgi:hypothetical protein